MSSKRRRGLYFQEWRVCWMPTAQRSKKRNHNFHFPGFVWVNGECVFMKSVTMVLLYLESRKPGLGFSVSTRVSWMCTCYVVRNCTYVYKVYKLRTFYENEITKFLQTSASMYIVFRTAHGPCYPCSCAW